MSDWDINATVDDYGRRIVAEHLAHGCPPGAVRCVLDGAPFGSDELPELRVRHAELQARLGAVQAGTEPEHLARPFFYREPANGVTLAVTYQGPDGIAFVAQPPRGADEPYEQYGVVLPWPVVERLARRVLASAPPAVTPVAESDPDSAPPVQASTAPHVYLSTACLHGRHEYCACDVRWLTGEKTPHTCKWCPAQCICPCHAEVVDTDA